MWWVDYRALKERVTVIDALRARGWQPTESRGDFWRGECPFHNARSRRPRSLRVTRTVWYCHRCRMGGDVIRLWAMLHDVKDTVAAIDLAWTMHADDLVVRSRHPATANREEAQCDRHTRH